MYVACPSCKTLYRIQPEHLELAGGRVRCGSCRTTFSAAGAAFEDPQQALACVERKQTLADDIDALVSRALERAPVPVEQGGSGGISAAAARGEVKPDVRPWPNGPPRTDSGVAAASTSAAVAEGWFASPVPEESGEEAPDESEAVGVIEDNDGEGSESQCFEWSPPTSDKAAGAEPSAARIPETAEDATDVGGHSSLLSSDGDFYAQPSPAEFAVAPRANEEDPSAPHEVLLLDDVYREGMSSRAWGAVAASLLLVALLVMQYGYAERHRLAALPQLRPALEFVCQTLGCDLPVRHDVGQVEILERQVRDHPRVEDALLINVSFVNKADFVQAFPLFEVSFSDVSGTPVAVGRFTPDEYLPESRRGSKYMQPGEHAQLMLEVIDPGERAVSFQFEFL
jgi:predicted Zn finger-like uncharacterized protein